MEIKRKTLSLKEKNLLIDDNPLRYASSVELTCCAGEPVAICRIMLEVPVEFNGLEITGIIPSPDS